jgi:hypothetical protein
MFGLFGRVRRSPARLVSRQPGPRRSRPCLEPLEDRQLLSTSSLVFPGADGHLTYVPDAQGNVIPDFSNVGYESGIAALPGTNGTPDVPVKVIVQPLAKGVDAGATIQAAIDRVSKLPLDANGFRGAVLLKSGLYPIKGQIRITTSGVVLRGEGTDVADRTSTGTVKVPVTGLTGTVLEATGTDRRYNPHLPFGDGLVQLEGAVPGGASWNGGDDFTPFAVAGTTHNITDNYVPVGAHSFHVDSIAGLHIGDSVIVHRPSTAAWLHAIGMDGSTDPWKPGQEDMDSDRVITAIDPVHNLITIDAPLTDALEKQFGGGTIFKYSFPGRIDHVGVENLSGFSDFDPTVTDKDNNQTDENHAWTFMSLAGVENAFVRQITAQHFAFSAVDVQKMSKWVTVADSQSLDPVSVIGGGRRDSFELGGQLTLVENCTSVHGRHDFVLHSALPGPNVFLNCVADQSFDESGPHLHWDTGVLYDHVTVTSAGNKDHPFGGSLEARNRKVVDGSQQGWTGANLVFWNCTADQMDVERPPTAQNWAIGCTTKVAIGNGFFESTNHPVDPHSLYQAQLADRLARFHSVSSLVHVTVTPVPGQSSALFITVTNVSNGYIPGPLLSVFTNLPQPVGLGSANSSTVAAPVYVAPDLSGLAAGQSGTALVSFPGLLSLSPHGITAEVLAELPPLLSLSLLETTIAPPTP